MQKFFVACWFLMMISCTLLPGNHKKPGIVSVDTSLKTDTIFYGDTSDPLYIHTGNTTPQELASYAQTLIGVPYLYASGDPAKGFDCSGFISYVFNHFNIDVPRSSVSYTGVPHEVPLTDAKPADLILFTGTDSTIRTVGHMGIIIEHNKNSLFFIHSTSGKANGVTITPLNDYYRGRFMKVIRVFPQNNYYSVTLKYRKPMQFILL